MRRDDARLPFLCATAERHTPARSYEGMFMSVLIQEKTRVEEEHIYLDPRISFQEIDRYFLSGCACAFFQVATDVYTDLRYNQEEWD